jgi:hypothetical protein
VSDFDFIFSSLPKFPNLAGGFGQRDPPEVV